MRHNRTAVGRQSLWILLLNAFSNIGRNDSQLIIADNLTKGSFRLVNISNDYLRQRIRGGNVVFIELCSFWFVRVCLLNTTIPFCFSSLFYFSFLEVPLIPGVNTMTLSKIIEVDREKCVNCHAA